ncbi:MAG: zinc ribbon domain-containing protein [bacterium]|nr:zinc ribbon domain-containing protein [bacterium]
MPTYEYKCSKCNHCFEMFQSISADPLKDCPECDGNIQKVIGSNIAISFKGSGFYVNDNKSKASSESKS